MSYVVLVLSDGISVTLMSRSALPATAWEPLGRAAEELRAALEGI